MSRIAPGAGHSLAWRGGVAALALVSAWLSFAAAAAQQTAASRMGIWPFAAKAKMSQAERDMQVDPDATKARAAASLARMALRSSPLDVGAARTLGLAEGMLGNDAASEKSFLYAETLSRRDLPTQLWLIERSVSQGNILEALRHYDRALRTNPQASGALFPILVQASADPDIAGPLSRFLAQRPTWWLDFSWQLVSSGGSNTALATIGPALKLNPNSERERPLLAAIIDNLASNGAYGPAYRLYQQSLHLPASSPVGVRNGDFDLGVNGLPPFDWKFADDADLGSVIQSRDDGEGSALYLFARGGKNGEVARQLLLLPAGNYRLSGLVGDVANDVPSRPRIVLACTGEKGNEIAVPVIPAATDRSAPFAVDFKVPAGCSAQLLRISLSAPIDTAEKAPWVDQLTVVRQ